MANRKLRAVPAAARHAVLADTTRAMNWARRRALFATLVIATVATLSGWLASVLTPGGCGLLAATLIVAFAIKATWVVINFWNAVIGFSVLRRGHAVLEGVVEPHSNAVRDRVAIAMTVCDENVAHLMARLKSVRQSLYATGYGDHFDYFLLSDSCDWNIAAAEISAVESWQAEPDGRQSLIYRRREQNAGSQHGNLYDFCQRFGADYDVMIVLDADSLMTGAAIVELVQIMQANPRIGMLQGVNSGILMRSLFARIFEFGHRHGMRCWIAGAVWWQGERGQYRGHNAAIRVAPYSKYCSLAGLPGGEPFGGVMFCHDQIESLLMHRAGFEIRELPVERGSYEGVPPTLADFVTRYCRWLQGNLKNLRMLRLPGLTAMDRYHLIGVAHRFMTWPAVVLFVAVAALLTLRWPATAPFPARTALGLYAAYFAIYFTPKALGLLDSALRAPKNYGGVVRLIAGGVLDVVLTLLFLPITMLTATYFVVGLIFGRTLAWDTQKREGYRLAWSAAARQLWSHTAAGLALLGTLAFAAPAAVLWFLPFGGGLVLAIPLAVFTASAEVNGLATRWKLCALPEEVEMPREVAAVLEFEAANGTLPTAAVIS